LLQGTQDHNLEARRACAEALGELGAIDPERLNLVIESKIEDDQDDDQIAIKLINNYLVRVYKTAQDPDVQDRSAYAIQEILKDRNINPKKKNGLWKQIPAEIQQIVHPFLNSQYKVQTVSEKELTTPIYRQNMAYVFWLTKWTKKLITHSAKKIFSACGQVLTADVEIAHYLLPHLVIELYESDDVARQDITREILAVLESSASDGTLGRTGGNLLGSPAKTAPKSRQNFHREHHLATQRIFYLVDYLQKKAEAANAEPKKGARTTARKSTSARKTPTVADAIENLLKEIPQITMANAAYTCKAYARALQHYELHVRQIVEAEREKLSDEQKVDSAKLFSVHIVNDIASLQKIYAGMNEPDSLIGLVNFRAQATLEEQIAEWEASEEWSKALLGYGRALQQNPVQVRPDLHLGRLRCLKNLGYFQEMLEISRGSLLRDEQLKPYFPTITSYGIQAAWNLGSWDSLTELLQNSSDVDLEVCLAKLLLAMKNREEDKFKSLLQMSRERVLAPLAAASMESYKRAYLLLTELHMLNEVEKNWAVMSTTGKK
jgi:serine/threonine-protein kinase ATR